MGQDFCMFRVSFIRLRIRKMHCGLFFNKMLEDEGENANIIKQ